MLWRNIFHRSPPYALRTALTVLAINLSSIGPMAGVMKIPPSRGLRLAAHALADLVSFALGQKPHYPLVSVPPGKRLSPIKWPR